MRAHSTAQQRVRGRALGGSHVLESEAIAHFRDEVPIEPFVCFQLERGFGALLRCERFEKLVRSGSHFLGSDMRVGGGNKGNSKKRNQQQCFHAPNSTATARKGKPKMQCVGWPLGLAKLRRRLRKTGLNDFKKYRLQDRNLKAGAKSV